MASPSGLRAIMNDVANAAVSDTNRRWLNLSIGNPALIPAVSEHWERLIREVVATSFADVTGQYAPSRGLPQLVDTLAGYFGDRYGWNLGPENIVVGPGSQMLCYIAAALFAGPGVGEQTRIVLPITPDYTGYQGLCMSPGGVVGIESILRHGPDRSFHYLVDLDAVRARTDAGLLLVSSPSNPVGRCLRPDELAALTEFAQQQDIPLIVDQAYGKPFPRVVGSATPPMWDEHIINCFSISKAGFPGERIGFAIGDPRYIEPMVAFIANSTLHAPTLPQAALSRALSSGSLDTVTASALSPFYTQRRKLAEELMAHALPDDIAWRLHPAEGGMYLWACIDEDWFDDITFYNMLRDRGVFITPGRYFFTESTSAGPASRHAQQCIRISITPDFADLAAGFEVIGKTLAEMSA
jgi:valine--pyruvate aminotransferase